MQEWFKKFKKQMEAENNSEVLKVAEFLTSIDGHENEENLALANQKILELSTKDSYVIGKLRRKYRLLQKRIERAVPQTFGAYMKYLREKVGYTLQEVTDKTDISSSYINRIEKGQRKAPSYPIMLKLAEAYNVDIASIMRVANQSEESIDLLDLLSSSKFTINGVPLPSEKSDLFLEIIEMVISPYNTESLIKDSIKLTELVDSFRREETS